MANSIDKNESFASLDSGSMVDENGPMNLYGYRKSSALNSGIGSSTSISNIYAEYNRFRRDSSLDEDAHTCGHWYNKSEPDGRDSGHDVVDGDDKWPDQKRQPRQGNDWKTTEPFRDGRPLSSYSEVQQMANSIDRNESFASLDSESTDCGIGSSSSISYLDAEDDRFQQDSSPDETIEPLRNGRPLSSYSESSLAESNDSPRGSIDSAIDMYIPKRSRKQMRGQASNTKRHSVYSTTSCDTIYETEIWPRTGEHIQMDSMVVEAVRDETVSEVRVHTQTESSPSVQVEDMGHATTEKPKVYRIVKFFRFILRIVSNCIRIPSVTSESGIDLTQIYTNPAYTEEIEDKTTEEGTSPDLNSDGKKNKKAFLESFDLMLEKALQMDIDVVGHVFKFANFAAALLDHRGGCLSLDDLNVHLYVPPGAISDKKRHKIYIFVTGTSSVENHHFSTPFVHCGPPDIVFSKNVVLTLPHCIKDVSCCKFTYSKLSSDGPVELKEGKDMIAYVDDDSVTMSVGHFCGFGATASPAGNNTLRKSMVACVFIHETDNEASIRLRLVDDIKPNTEETIEDEKKHEFFLADATSPLSVQKTGRPDVVAEVSSCIDNSWKICDPESCKQRFDPFILWRENTTASPSVMFSAKRCTGSTSRVPFKAHLKVYQEHSESSVYVLDFLVKRQQALDPVDTVQLKNDTFLEHLHKIKSGEMKRAETRPLDEDTFQQLCDVLDDNMMDIGINDWQVLPGKLLGKEGHGCVYVRKIGQQAGRERRSPSEIIFDIFFAKQSGKTKVQTLTKLRDALIAMSRCDAQFAVDAINKQLKSLEDGDTEQIKQIQKYENNNNTKQKKELRSPSGVDHAQFTSEPDQTKRPESDAADDGTKKGEENTEHQEEGKASGIRKDSAYNSGVAESLQSELVKAMQDTVKYYTKDKPHNIQ